MGLKQKIMVAMPCGNDTIKVKTAFSLINALKALTVDYDILIRMGCDIIGARTGLVNESIKRGATHIMFIDHDMFFPPDAIQKLVVQDKDIIGTAYNFRRFPLQSIAIPLSDITPTHETFRCQALGTGFLLIKLSVFEKIPVPWFNFGRDENAELVYGEDTYFCQQAIKAGLDVWADPNLGVKHIGEFNY